MKKGNRLVKEISLSGSSSLDHTIVEALERVSQVFRTLLWEAGKPKKLSPIQIQFLLYISAHHRKFSSVSELSRTFHLTPATVSDAIKSLEQKGIVQKIISRRDGRKFPISLTREGFSLAKQLSSCYKPVLELIHNFPTESREAVMIFLLRLLESFRSHHLLDEVKTCLSCAYFQNEMDSITLQEPFCLLRNVPLPVGELRLNCPNFHLKNI